MGGHAQVEQLQMLNGGFDDLNMKQSGLPPAALNTDITFSGLTMTEHCKASHTTMSHI